MRPEAQRRVEVLVACNEALHMAVLAARAQGDDAGARRYRDAAVDVNRMIGAIVKSESLEARAS